MHLLYHVTCRQHLTAIIRSGTLAMAESNIGSPWPWSKPFAEHIGPDVVWLTDDCAAKILAVFRP